MDTGAPILPVQMLRGYGGVAIPWKKAVDHLVKGIPDGLSRIQSIEVQAQQPTLVDAVQGIER